MMLVTAIESKGKGKYNITFDEEKSIVLYWKEMKDLSIETGVSITEEQYGYILHDVIGKRAKKRALHILEKMDRTEYQLRDKLSKGDYPEECVDLAVEYVKSYKYIDDYRYSCNYVRFSQDKMSRNQIKQKLISKGVSRNNIEMALEEEFKADETLQIEILLDKRKFTGESDDKAEFQRTYQYILRRGFKSGDILKAMKQRVDVFQ